MSAEAVDYQEAVASRLNTLAAEAYDAVREDAAQFFANQDAGSTRVVEEGRIVVCGDGSCRYQAVQPYGESTRIYRQVPLDAAWTDYCEEVYAPLAAAAADSREMPDAVARTVTRLEPGDVTGDPDLAGVQAWLEQHDPEPVVEHVVYRG